MKKRSLKEKRITAILAREKRSFCVVMEIENNGLTLAGYVLNDKPLVGFTMSECLELQKRLKAQFKNHTNICDLEMCSDYAIPHYFVKADYHLASGL